MNIVDYIKSKIESCTKKKINFKDGSTCSKSTSDLTNWVKKNFADFSEDTEIKDEAAKGFTHIKDTIEKSFIDIVKKAKVVVTKVEGGVLDGIVTEEEVDSYYKNLVPIVDAEAAEKKKQILMVDKEEGYRISSVTFEAWSITKDGEYINEARRCARHVKLRYVPTDIRSFLPLKIMDKVKVPILNTYTPPDHRLNEIKSPVVPDLVWKYLKTLFKNKECFEFMMESVWYILNSRLQVIPVLNGGTGIGKGIFTDKLLKGLVGEQNTMLAPVSWDKSGFNAWLLNRQIIVFDEAKIISNGKDSNVDILKRITNDTLNVEKKGVDADRLTENHASMVITSNNGNKRFKLELDNRRFSPVDLTTKKIEVIYSKEKKEELLNILGSSELHANFYWAIQNNWSPNKRKNGRSENTILQCEALYRFQYESLMYWQKGIVDLILSKESDEYTMGEVNVQARKAYTEVTGRETNSKRVVDKVDLIDFLSLYRYYGEEVPMATVKTDSTGVVIVVAAKKYKSEHSGFKQVGLDAL